MTIGTIKAINGKLYFVVNSSGTLEAAPAIKWSAQLYFEIRQGIGKPLPLAQLRAFIQKHKKAVKHE